MFEFFKTLINAEDFDLPRIIDRITAVYANGKLSNEQYNELVGLAHAKANPVAGLPPMEERINLILEKLEDIEARLSALEESDAPAVDPENPDDPPEEDPLADIPEWKQPVGTIGMYMKGDKVKYNGKVYQSVIDNNVWSPEAYPQGWQEVVIESAPEEDGTEEE